MVWYQTRFYHKSRVRVLAVYLSTNHSLSTAPIPLLQTHTAVRLITLQTSLHSVKHSDLNESLNVAIIYIDAVIYGKDVTEFMVGLDYI